MPALEPFDLVGLLLVAALNPAVIAVAFIMGRKADQWQKIIVAAFAASLAGFVLVWLSVRTGVIETHGMGTEAGLIAIQFLLGLLWAAAGYISRRWL